MYDLSDYSSLEQLFIFFESLNNKFEMKNNDIKCFLIGNKNDRKVILNTEQNNKLSNFIKKSNFIRSFEISSKLSFNFNKFFQLFIEEILDKEYTYEMSSLIPIGAITDYEGSSITLTVKIENNLNTVGNREPRNTENGEHPGPPPTEEVETIGLFGVPVIKETTETEESN